MDYGIIELQLDTIFPPQISTPEAVSHLMKFGREMLIIPLVKAGFSTIELNGDLSLIFPTAYSAENMKTLAALKSEHKLRYTLHLPLWSVEPSTPLDPVRKGSVDALVNIIQAVEPISPDIFVLHATGALAAEFYRMQLPPQAKAFALQQFQSNAMRSIESLLEKTGLPSRKCAIETIEFPFDLTLEIAEALDLSLCLDTGHILAGFAGPISIPDTIKACEPRLAEIHLHDSANSLKTGKLGYGKDHQTLGTQDLDCADFIKRIRAINFSGPIIFELSLAQAQKSLTYLEKIEAEK
jgi:sugar phosphate isomerase/epimerase